MAIPDLFCLRRLAERHMVDTCTITRDTPGTDDDLLDQTTGVLTPPASDSNTVYEGKCMVYPSALSPKVDAEGDRSFTEKIYTASIPWDSAEPKVGDVLTMTTTTRDPALFGRIFRIKEILFSTFLVSRDMVVEDRG